jgi:hypothetical protein
VLSLADLKGLWRRALLQRGGQEADRTSSVYWLQGPRFFVDLRQPADLAAFDGIRCLHDLHIDQCRELARQEGFAGALTLVGTIAEWQRTIDFQPETGIADRARLQLAGQILTEIGTEATYVEEWQRETDADAIGWGARLIEAGSGRAGFIACAGRHLMFARDRAQPLPSGSSLRIAFDAAETPQARYDLIDFEISLGRIEADGHWLIERSTLPFKQGRRWGVAWNTEPANVLNVDDLNRDGTTLTRRWHIIETDIPHEPHL